ncbi:PDZ domain-containing RING finger protein 4 isoform X2 [Anguilla rostrata]|uniref:PDZ domain-containing RING finger protein 4 isoform X2 n=1 Tax=Anguilla rostrata TaxID=7938 RepID=UPI0030D1DF83
MGCSLCALRKREERYKLLYEIAQVNGKDVSKVTAEEATAEALRSGGDPMAAQVPRRNPASPDGHGNPRDARLADVCTQTDITFQHIMALAKLRPLTPPLPDLCPFLLSDSCHSLQTVEQEFYEGTEYLSHTPASGERADEFEYEEVELCRLNSQEKLGLTLCYRTDEEEDAGIYVSEVGQDSVAARDGRIREGDRILQINGQDVQNREEAMTALSNEDCRNILLLVARPEIQLEEGWLDDEQGRFLEELKMEMLEEQREEEDQHTSSGEQQPKGCEEEDDEEETTTDATTRSSNTQDPVEPEAEAGPPSCAMEQEGMQRELRLLSEELRSIERECQSIMQARRLRLARDPAPGPGPAPAPGPAHADKDSSSAYDTAESCRSTPPPPARRRSPDRSAQSAVSAANLRNLSRTAAPPAPCLSPSRHGDVPAPARRYQSSAHLVQQSQLGLPTAGRDPPPPRAEWRAQRCPARRPARDRLLRERALKIREERGGGGGGTTTDDDAASELKLGRYWSREERKQHLLRAREQRRRREFMVRSRLESLRESPQSGGEGGGGGGGGGRKEVSILELSRRKMMRKRRRKILDNWMTIQELMSHGARRPEDTGVHSAFLSVTTV